MVIYLDVLVLINLYVTYFQILAVSVLTHRKSYGTESLYPQE